MPDDAIERARAIECLAQEYEATAPAGKYAANDIRNGILSAENERALRAMLAFAQQAPGMVLVPREPTEAMLDAGVPVYQRTINTTARTPTNCRPSGPPCSTQHPALPPHPPTSHVERDSTMNIHTTPALSPIAALSQEIHAANVAAGWWSDLHTGMSILETRNRGEILMLVVSELSEASQGIGSGLMDDKLPHLPMYDVELADTAIRLFDIIGAERVDITPAAFDLRAAAHGTALAYRSVDGQLMYIVNLVSAAMEHHRKRRTEPYGRMLVDALAATVALAQLNRIDLFSVIDEKRAFNAVRPDHQVANRRGVGGKKC